MRNTREQESLKNIVEILKVKNKELRLLYESSRFFSTTLEINELYDKLFDVLRNIVDFQDMFVARYNEAERTIKYIYLRSVLEEDRIDVSTIPIIPLAPEGKGIISEAIRNNDTVVVNDYQDRLKKSAVKYHITNAGELSEKDMGKEYIIESAMIVPIKLNGRILGFITLMCKDKDGFNSSNLNWIETMVNQAAIANKNAILFSELQEDNKKIDLLETQLKNTANTRDLLRQEASKRSKENMKLISNMLQFQLDYIKDPVQREYSNVLRSRANVISLIQDKLYSYEDISSVDFESMLQNLLPSLYETYDVSSKRISVYLNLHHLKLPVDTAVKCSLIVNELAINSLLHSFPHKKKGNITIDMHEEKDGKYYLSVRDNGIGAIAGKSKPQSFSMVFVGMLVKELKGTFELDRTSGTKVVIRF